jgi:glycosyltransferase involved in cell wall biosynthesis
MQHPVLFQWAVSTLFGWGVYGLNLLRHWDKVAGSPAYCGAQIHLESLQGMDPLNLRAIAQKLVDSDQLFRSRMAGGNPPFSGLVLNSMGNKFSGGENPARGRATAGVTFFEDTDLPNAEQVSKNFDLIVTGSTWNEKMLREAGMTNVATVIQGIDPSLFHPAPRAGTLDGRFAVFSGGKLEFRKGQDLVLLAFRAFAQRHPEAVLVTAWHSPWPAAAQTCNINPRIQPVVFTADGKLDTAAWARVNGIRDEQFIDLGSIPNHLMGRVVREMDVAIFPNRCEGGTNLVAMETMACGVPVIVADNTGQKDLVATGAPYVLSRQGPASFPGWGTREWGESEIDEMVEALEAVWRDREAARAKGLQGAEAMAKWSWRNQIAQLHETLSPLCP